MTGDGKCISKERRSRIFLSFILTAAPFCLLIKNEIGGRSYGSFDFTTSGLDISHKNFNRSVFNAFFSTSTPASFDAPNEEQLIGTGLGLKIVKDIIVSYKGSICIIPSYEEYSTCFQIKIPKN